MIGALGALLAGPAAAQEFKAQRFEEEWRSYADAAKRDDPLDALKFVPLNEVGSRFITFGGQARERLELLQNQPFGRNATDDDPDLILLHRFLLHADIHLEPWLRSFVELGYTRSSGRSGGPLATDEDRPDATQAFVELGEDVAGGRSAGIRAGRQEMVFGQQRLVTVRDGPNHRRTFDQVRLYGQALGARIDVFAGRPTRVEPGAFDNGPNRSENFWGIHLTRPGVLGPAALDLYYFGLDREGATYAPGAGDDRRNTWGARLWGRAAGFDWDLEGAVQRGAFRGLDVRAWLLAFEGGYTFSDLPWRPRLSLRANHASGDDNRTDGALETFNPLYPRAPYFTEAAISTLANIINIYPGLTVRPMSGVTVFLGLDVQWRAAAADAYYLNTIRPVAGTAGRAGRFAGLAYTASAEWAFNPRLALRAAYVHFDAAADTFGSVADRDSNFAATWLTFRF